MRVTNEQLEQEAEGLGVPPEEDDEYMELSQLQVRCVPAGCPPPDAPASSCPGPDPL